MRLLPLTLLCGSCAGLAAAAQAGVPEGDDWALARTVMAPQPMALIAAADGSETVVKPGQRLSGCLLHDVEVTFIVLACADGQVRVPVKSGLGSQSQAFTDSPTRDVAVDSASAHRLRTGAASLAREVSLQPERRAGRIYGYRIEHLEAGSAFDDIGLAEDDIITAVNGASAREPGPFFHTMNGLAEMPAFSFHVQRGEERLRLRYDRE